MGVLRLVEFVFLIYFVTHIPITILIDSQAVYPREWYSEQLLNLTDWYVKELKDPYFAAPPTWYMTFVYFEQFIQLPFFFVASYAFLKGSCQWIRVPTLIYASHVATTVLPMLVEMAVNDYSKAGVNGPTTKEERMVLVGIYMPYFAIPLLMILTMLVSKTYKGEAKATKGRPVPVTKQSPKKKHQKTH